MRVHPELAEGQVMYLSPMLIQLLWRKISDSVLPLLSAMASVPLLNGTPNTTVPASNPDY